MNFHEVSYLLESVLSKKKGQSSFNRSSSSNLAPSFALEIFNRTDRSMINFAVDAIVRSILFFRKNFYHIALAFQSQKFWGLTKRARVIQRAYRRYVRQRNAVLVRHVMLWKFREDLNAGNVTSRRSSGEEANLLLVGSGRRRSSQTAATIGPSASAGAAEGGAGSGSARRSSRILDPADRPSIVAHRRSGSLDVGAIRRASLQRGSVEGPGVRYVALLREAKNSSTKGAGSSGGVILAWTLRQQHPLKSKEALFLVAKSSKSKWLQLTNVEELSEVPSLQAGYGLEFQRVVHMADPISKSVKILVANIILAQEAITLTPRSGKPKLVAKRRASEDPLLRRLTPRGRRLSIPKEILVAAVASVRESAEAEPHKMDLSKSAPSVPTNLLVGAQTSPPRVYHTISAPVCKQALSVDTTSLPPAYQPTLIHSHPHAPTTQPVSHSSPTGHRIRLSLHGEDGSPSSSPSGPSKPVVGRLPTAQDLLPKSPRSPGVNLMDSPGRLPSIPQRSPRQSIAKLPMMGSPSTAPLPAPGVSGSPSQRHVSPRPADTSMPTQSRPSPFSATPPLPAGIRPPSTRTLSPLRLGSQTHVPVDLTSSTSSTSSSSSSPNTVPVRLSAPDVEPARPVSPLARSLDSLSQSTPGAATATGPPLRL